MFGTNHKSWIRNVGSLGDDPPATCISLPEWDVQTVFLAHLNPSGGGAQRACTPDNTSLLRVSIQGTKLLAARLWRSIVSETRARQPVWSRAPSPSQQGAGPAADLLGPTRSPGSPDWLEHGRVMPAPECSSHSTRCPQRGTAVHRRIGQGSTHKDEERHWNIGTCQDQPRQGTIVERETSGQVSLSKFQGRIPAQRDRHAICLFSSSELSGPPFAVVTQ
jgi:hypothetical protein